MPDERHLSSAPNLAPAEEAWTTRSADLYELGEISPNQARQRSGLLVPEHKPDEHGSLPGHVNSVGTKATTGMVGLELVTDSHAPRPDARRTPNLRKPRPARTPKAKLARDMGERLKHATPPEWQTHLTVLDGDAHTDARAGADR